MAISTNTTVNQTGVKPNTGLFIDHTHRLHPYRGDRRQRGGPFSHVVLS